MVLFGIQNAEIYGIGVVVVIVIFFVILFLRNRYVPSRREMRPLRSLGYFGAGGRLVSGRQMARGLISGIKISWLILA